MQNASDFSSVRNAEIRMSLRVGSTVDSLRSEYARIGYLLSTRYGLSAEKINAQAARFRASFYDDASGDLETAAAWVLAIGIVQANYESRDPDLF